MLYMIGGYLKILQYAPSIFKASGISELLPTEIRGKGVAAGLFVNSIASGVVSTVFLSVQVKIGLSGSYILFAFFTALYFFVAMKCMPEVKRQSLDDVEKRFSS